MAPDWQDRQEGKAMNEHARHLVAAREHHRASRWVQACEGYSAADRVTPLGIEDLEGWAEAAQVIGRVDEAIDVLARCFERRAQSGEIHEATCAAYWLWSAHVFTRGEFAIAAGWVARPHIVVAMVTKSASPLPRPNSTARCKSPLAVS